MHYGKPKHPRGRRSDQLQFYMNAHPTCEACGIVESRDGHHIVTRATGGLEEDWNYLALCVVCHTTWHNIGRKSFAARYPHLDTKIKESVKRHGRKW
jgi:hypothetical protein